MKRPFEQSEIEYIRQHYSDTPTADIAAALKRHPSSVYGKAYQLGLCKSEDFHNSGRGGRLTSGCGRGIQTRFKKGASTWNKGKKLGPEWTKGRMANTQFKAGHLPHNTKEGDGALTKRSCGYWWIRLSLKKWRQLHTHIWEKANRPINPKTEMVKFRDGNRDNCALENLYLENRAGNMAANTIQRYPENIKGAVRAKSSLTRMINSHAKKKN